MLPKNSSSFRCFTPSDVRAWQNAHLMTRVKISSRFFETILAHVPPPSFEPDAPFQMLVSDLDYSDYLGRLAVGRVFNGSVSSNEQLTCLMQGGKSQPLKVTRLQVYEGLRLVPADKVEPGDVVTLAGIEAVTIGDTICTKDAPVALPRIQVDEPTVAMRFACNTSPLAGKEGSFVQSSKIGERLIRETLKNVFHSGGRNRRA